MHVYGWAISAKLADRDWNKRRTTDVGSRGWDARQMGDKREDGVDYRRRDRSARSHVGHSYAEVVKSGREYRPDVEKNSKQHSCTKSMFWYGSSEDVAWLSKSAIGWLKDFGSFEPVNRNLESRGCAFTTAYLGGKGIVWTFDSEWDRDCFINNEFLWRDYFVSMCIWDEEFALSTSLKWIDIYGVPLNCWSTSFFKELSNQMGELVWLDEDTRSRGRLDKGRIIVLGAQNKNISSVIKVQAGKRQATVRMVESSDQVSNKWVDEHLGLKHGALSVENIQIQEQMKSSGCQVGGKSRMLDKGKGRWTQKLKYKNRKSSNYKGYIRIGEARVSNKRESSGEDYSSSETRPDYMDFFGPKFLRGECSKHKQTGLMIKPMNNASLGSITESEIVSLGQVGLLVNYMGQEERPVISLRSSEGNENQMDIQKSSAVLTNEGKREKGIKLYVDLRNHDSESNNHRAGEEDIEAEGDTIDKMANYSQKRSENGVELVRTEQDVRADRGESGLPKNKKDRSKGLDSNLKTHSMTTRRSKVITPSGQMESGALVSKGEQRRAE
ncbi:hypothetical protein Dsin_008375 [Dipteronia sinensis]|uniref:DUF4283 domain-containing protein n=1 Tax=Dipteronia sinensis TaxID=43782 RepID=A0AAE0ECG0_9ROSI|nr:hypothetical protein Dsin_008375 [Dipteronia sinensis]